MASEYSGERLSAPVNFQELLLRSPVAMYYCDVKGYLVFYNEAAATLWGRSPEAGKERWSGSWKICHPGGQQFADGEHPVAAALRDRTKAERVPARIERPDHTVSYVEIYAVPLFNADQQLTGMSCTMVDVTAHDTEETRRAMLAAIVEFSDDAIISKNLDGIILSWNSGAQRIFGYTEQETLGKHITLLIPESRLAEEQLIIDHISKGERIGHFETIRIGKDGREIPISLTISPIRNSEGKVIGASKVARDITDQLAAKQLISKYTRNLEMLNALGKGISEKMDVELVLQRVIEVTAKITGAAFGFFEKFDRSQHTALFHPAFMAGRIIRADDITKDPDYGLSPLNYGIPEMYLPVASYLAVPVTSNSDEVIGGLFFGHPEPGVFKEEHEDIVMSIASQAAIAIDNARLFEEVRSLSAKKDEFIALASHELKTPLTSIKGYLQVLGRVERGQMEQKFLEKSLNQVEKLNKLVDDMLNMSKIEAGKLQFNIESFDMTALLQETLEAIAYTNTTHQIVQELHSGPVMVEGDKQRIEQVIINLVNNAIKYSPGAEQVRVSLESDHTYLTVSVRDEGIGLTPEQQERIFSRFYRAEGTGGIGGLGLGLYLTKEIIDRHHGSIRVKSEYGNGSEFIFSLPLKSRGLV